MTDSTADEAVAAVRAQVELADRAELIATALPDFPEFWYVTGQDGGRPTIGGTAFVVARDSKQVTEVPGSRPPRLNCEDVRHSRAERAGN